MTKPQKSDQYEFRPKMLFNLNDSLDARIIAVVESISAGDKAAFVKTLLRAVFSGDPTSLARLMAEVNAGLQNHSRSKPGRPRAAETRTRVAAIKKAFDADAAAANVNPATVTAAREFASSTVVSAQAPVIPTATPVAIPATPVAHANQIAQNEAVPAEQVAASVASGPEDLSRFASSGLLGSASW